MRPHKFFFAIQPPTEAAAAISQLATTLASQHDAVPLRADNLHVSLNGVGQYAAVPADIVDRVIAAAAEVNFAPFDVVFDRVLTWGRGQNRHTVLRCSTGEPELGALYTALYVAMTRNGIPVKEAPGIPHMTLLYGRAVLPEQDLPHPFVWRVDRFCLIHSIHATGCHKLVADWLLQGKQSTDPPSTTGLLL